LVAEKEAEREIVGGEITHLGKLASASSSSFFFLTISFSFSCPKEVDSHGKKEARVAGNFYHSDAHTFYGGELRWEPLIFTTWPRLSLPRFTLGCGPLTSLGSHSHPKNT